MGDQRSGSRAISGIRVEGRGTGDGFQGLGCAPALCPHKPKRLDHAKRLEDRGDLLESNAVGDRSNVERARLLLSCDVATRQATSKSTRDSVAAHTTASSTSAVAVATAASAAVAALLGGVLTGHTRATVGVVGAIHHPYAAAYAPTRVVVAYNSCAAHPARTAAAIGPRSACGALASGAHAVLLRRGEVDQ